MNLIFNALCVLEKYRKNISICFSSRTFSPFGFCDMVTKYCERKELVSYFSSIS